LLKKKVLVIIFYGDTEETLRTLNYKLSLGFPKLKITGSFSPPFKELTRDEDEEIVRKINQAKPDVFMGRAWFAKTRKMDI